jgi:hypothetical protein
MYENLEKLHPLGKVLLKDLSPVSGDDLKMMRHQWPEAPEEYFLFIQEVGCGAMKEEPDGFPLMVFNRDLVDAESGYFGDDQVYKDGPYEPGAKGKVWIFGVDSTGTALGFDSGDEWRILEVDNMRWVTRLDLTFKQFVEGLFFCYPQRPVKYSQGRWYDSGGNMY